MTHRNLCEFPRNIIHDIIENIENKEDAEKCSIKYAVEHFEENIARPTEHISDRDKIICLDYYINSNITIQSFAEKYELSESRIKKIIQTVLQTLGKKENYPYFFVCADYVDEVNHLEEEYLKKQQELQELQAKLERKLELVRKEIAMVSVPEPKVRMENCKLITTKESVDILPLTEKTLKKLKYNKILFINQLVNKTEDEIFNIIGITEREAFDIFRELSRIGYEIKK